MKQLSNAIYAANHFNQNPTMQNTAQTVPEVSKESRKPLMQENDG